MGNRIFKFVAVFMLVTMIFAPFSSQPVNANSQVTELMPVKHLVGVSETGIYIVRLTDASLASYQGGVAGYKATSPEATGARRLDTSTFESKAYLDYLSVKQDALLDMMSKVFGHPVDIVYRYENVLNAVAVRIDHEEALQALYLPGVSAVYPDRLRQVDTDSGPTLLGAPSIWSNEVPGGVGTYGEGIIIGVIDGGINHAHPSFADVGGDGYDHTNPYGAGTYVGYCIDNPDFCNDKLIGAYDLYPGGSGGPDDTDGHGSHTSSTAGGNFVDVEFDDGAGGVFTATISGVAPHSNIIAYKICSPSCPGSAAVEAVDHAISDDVDVLNYSISGSDDPWNDAVDLAFLDAYAAGIFVSASAGNYGPDPETVAKTGPWNAAVAASTHSRIMAHPLDVNAAAGSLLGLGALEGTGPVLTSDLTAPILYAGDVDPLNFEGCNAWPAGTFEGKIGLVKRGTCSFAIKVDNLTAAGAVGALVFNNLGGPPIVMGALEATIIPSMMISLNDGNTVVALISGDATATATMYVAQNFVYNDDWADIMASFSSRGPSQWELLKPDYTAPGVNILAAVAAADGDPVQYDFYQGTSMSSPHGAGSAALLTALHPDWSPAEIKSAIATTADQAVLDSDGATPADPFDDGSGRIDLAAAAYAGFVLDETTANYIAANPDLGGQPRDLNQPSAVDYTCIGTCNWTRTIKSTLDVPMQWEISFDQPPSMTLSASPMTFTLEAGATQIIEITADVSAGDIDQYYFGDVILTPVDAMIAVSHLPIVAQLRMSTLPDLVNIVTSDINGTLTLNDLQALIAIDELTASVSGLVRGDVHDILLNQDPTNGDAFDDLDQVYWAKVNIGAGTHLRMVTEIVESEALDVDLFVGSGSTPSTDTILCTSATGVWSEYCEIENPASGPYWVLVQNWQGSTDQPDAIKGIVALVGDTDAGNMTITGPISVPTQELFDLDVNWNDPSLVPGDHLYGRFVLGSDVGQPGNLGYVNVNLDFIEQIYDIELAPTTDTQTDFPGSVVTYTLTISNFGTGTDTVTLAATGNLWDVNLNVTSVDVKPGETVEVAIAVSIPMDAEDGDFDEVTITATSEGGYQVTSVLTTTAEIMETSLPLVVKH